MKKFIGLFALLFLSLGANVANVKKVSGDGIVVQGRDGSTALIKSTQTANIVSSINYTILPTDNYDMFLVSTGNSDRTITLPLNTTGYNRRLFIKKTDTGTGHVIVSPNGGNIEGNSLNHLFAQGAFVELLGDSTNWNVTRAFDFVSSTASGTIASTGNAYFDVTSLSVPEGDWSVSTTTRFDRNAATAIAYINGFIGTITGNNGTGACDTSQPSGLDLNTGVGTTAWNTINYTSSTCRIRVSAVTTYFHKGLYNISVNSNSFAYSGYIQLVRSR